MNGETSFLARAIQNARHRRQWTQQELAQRLGVSQSTISFWERGLEHPALAHQVELVAHLPEVFQELANAESELLTRLSRLERAILGGKCSCVNCTCTSET